jgi:hypothetical protein
MKRLTDWFWKKLARSLGDDQLLVSSIIASGTNFVYKHLYHSDGSDYMGRWWLMPRWLTRIDEEGNPYPYSWLPFIVRLHHIRSEDWDRDLHDHPSWYRTIILRGWYLEQDIYGDQYLRQQGETKTASAETFHKITQISDGGVWTIFIMGRKTNKWGFLVDGWKVPWRKYWDKKLAMAATGTKQ